MYPKYFAIPKEDSEHFETFCWSELLLYKNFREIHIDIGVDKDDIIRHWKQLKIETYNVWHVDRTDQDDEILEEENDSNGDMDIQYSMQLNEWEFLSQLCLASSSSLNDLDMLGKRDFDNNHPWEDHNVPLNLHDHAIQFIHR